MNEGLEEFGTVMLYCIIGMAAILLVSTILKEAGLMAKFAELYTEYFNGTAS